MAMAMLRPNTARSATFDTGSGPERQQSPRSSMTGQAANGPLWATLDMRF